MRSLIVKRILKIGCAKPALHIGSVFVLWERLGIIAEGGVLAIHFRGEAHSFVCFAGMVEESGAEKCSEKALSLAADDVFGNYLWFAFNTNFCFRGYVMSSSDILNVRESYTLGSYATVLQSEVYAILACLEYCLSEGIVNRAVSICSDSRAALLALNCMPYLPELYYSAEILFKNWLCLTEFAW
jgi:hypothetical protein